MWAAGADAGSHIVGALTRLRGDGLAVRQYDVQRTVSLVMVAALGAEFAPRKSNGR